VFRFFESGDDNRLRDDQAHIISQRWLSCRCTLWSLAPMQTGRQ
jgi:hypothetical protein